MPRLGSSSGVGLLLVFPHLEDGGCDHSRQAQLCECWLREPAKLAVVARQQVAGAPPDGLREFLLIGGEISV